MFIEFPMKKFLRKGARCNTFPSPPPNPIPCRQECLREVRLANYQSAVEALFKCGRETVGEKFLIWIFSQLKA